jgi:hypothetical protein
LAKVVAELQTTCVRNAAMQSFFSTLRMDRIYRKKYFGRAQE